MVQCRGVHLSASRFSCFDGIFMVSCGLFIETKSTLFYSVLNLYFSYCCIHLIRTFLVQRTCTCTCTCTHPHSHCVFFVCINAMCIFCVFVYTVFYVRLRPHRHPPPLQLKAHRHRKRRRVSLPNHLDRLAARIRSESGQNLGREERKRGIHEENKT